MCVNNGAKCIINVDAFYFITGLCTIIGLFWFVYYRKTMNSLQSLPKTAWKISKSSNIKKPLIVL